MLTTRAALSSTVRRHMSESLATLTAQRLRDAGIAFVAGASETLRVAAREPAIGDLVVSFEGNEVSVFLGDITHCHFTPYAADEKLPGCTDEQAVTAMMKSPLARHCQGKM